MKRKLFDIALQIDSRSVGGSRDLSVYFVEGTDIHREGRKSTDSKTPTTKRMVICDSMLMFLFFRNIYPFTYNNYNLKRFRTAPFLQQGYSRRSFCRCGMSTGLWRL